MTTLQAGADIKVGTSKETRIPVHIRFVPRDVWLRMHINTGSTIGAVKDAALERIDLPPLDPTIMPDFYDTARNSMTKPAHRASEARSFPKAFIARRPKNSLAELMASDNAKKESNQSMKAAFISSPNKSKSRKKDLSEKAKRILGSGPGESSIGSLGYISTQNSEKVLQQQSMDSLSGDISRKTENSRLVSSPSSSSTSSRFINSVKGGARGPKARASMASLSAAVKAVHRAASSRDLQVDSAEVLSGQDTFSEFLASGLPGNAEAKRKEEEAMNGLKKTDYANSPPSSPLSKQYKLSYYDQVKSCSSDSQSITSSLNEEEQIGTINTAADQTELDLDFSSSSDNESEQSVNNDKLLVGTKTLLSSESDLSSASHLERHDSPVSSPVSSIAVIKTGRERMQSQTMADFANSTDSPPPMTLSRPKAISTTNSSTERGRSGTIVPTNRDSSRKGKIPPDMIRSYSDQSAQSAFYDNAKGGHPMQNTEANRAPTTRRSQELPRMSREIPTSRPHQNWNDSNKLAGIRLDEISSWKDARHAMSHHFTTYSFSNGNMLEDWRTVAAFHIRPFELLEIHYANPCDRSFIPRESAKMEDLQHRSSSATLLETQVDSVKNEPYIEPRSEAWCYVYKPNTGPGKAQRAGLGVWKLRFIIIREHHMIICRKKPIRGHGLHDADIWPLDLIDCIWTESAKGGTQPSLATIKGECQDILTLRVPANMAPEGSALVTSYGDSSYFASLSMRFISQADCRAFYNTFARAIQSTMAAQASGKSAWVNEWRKKVVTRSTIAGMGGVVLPSKMGRRKGRNALSRIRLRPAGIDRAFDDVDQWSSHSENEDHGKVKGGSDSFNYAVSNIVNKEQLSINPAFQMEPLSKTTSIQSSLAPVSPKTTRVNLSSADELEHRTSLIRAATSAAILSVTTSTVTSTPERNTPKAERRSRGFSLAKVARRVVTPSIDKSSFRGSTDSAPSFEESTPGDRRRTATPSDFSDQGITRSTPGSPTKNPLQYHHTEIVKVAETPSTPIRRSSQSYLHSNKSGPSTPSTLSSPRRDLLNRTTDISADLARGTRNRSQTVVQLSSIPLPPSPNEVRRSVDLRQTIYGGSPAANNTSNQNNTISSFHWPFRGTSHRASTAARSALNKEMAD